MADGKWVKGRKTHRCTLCDLPILAGELSWSERLTPWDHPDNDSYGQFRAHQLCEEIWREMCQEYDGTFPDPCTWQAEEIGQHYPLCDRCGPYVPPIPCACGRST